MRPNLQVLSVDQIEQIIDEAKRVLAEIGIEVRGPRLRQRLLEQGLPLDRTGQRTWNPEGRSWRALANAPSFV